MEETKEVKKGQSKQKELSPASQRNTNISLRVLVGNDKEDIFKNQESK